MSIFHTAKATCGKCGHVNDVERVASVNADLRPDLREAILDRTFQREVCAKCGTALRLQPHLTYLDFARGLWVMVEPADTIEKWKQAEADARRTWDRSFGMRASPHGRSMGLSMRSRLAFGWTALREKILCDELGLDDVTLELLKLTVIRDMAAPPLADQTELRLVSGDAKTLRLDWIELSTERSISGVQVPRTDHDAIIAAAADWADARATFDGALLVDWRRMMFDGVAA